MPAVLLSRFTTERIAEGRQVLKTGFAPEVMNYAKRGVTDSLRPAVWRAILGLPKVRSVVGTVCVVFSAAVHVVVSVSGRAWRAFERTRAQEHYITHVTSKRLMLDECMQTVAC